MATNVYFDNFTNTPEQSLIEDLVIESIRIYGHDVYYCPRTIKTIPNNTYNEDHRSEYNDSYYVEMYIKNVEGFEGEGDFLSKFNIQIKDEITFTVANKVYNETIGDFQNSERPREGDLIYMPLTKKVYVIKFVEHEAIFYQMGSLQTYDIRCELFTYSNEKLATGVPELDAYEEKYTLAAQETDGLQRDANNNVIVDADTGRPVGVDSSWNPDDPFGQNDLLQTKAIEFIDFTEEDPFSEGGRY
jgi:hypothetical protein